MKQLLRMSGAPVTALFALAFVGMATPAAAAKYEYCRQDSVSGMRSCGFETMEQCQAMSWPRWLLLPRSIPDRHQQCLRLSTKASPFKEAGWETIKLYRR